MTGSLAKATFETTGESTMSGLPSRAAIEAAIKKTEYKYFGYYEMSDDQLAAVDVLVECGLALIDHLEADGGVEAMRERCAVYVENWRDGLKPLLKTDPRDNFLRGEINAANTLAATIRALPVLGVGR